MLYSNAHRLFLQTFISHHILDEDKVAMLYVKVCEKYQVDAPSDQLTQFIHLINKTMESLFMEIRQGRAEDTGIAYYALVNTLEDENAKFASNYTPQEIDYIKRVINRLVTSEEGLVSSIDLLNEGHDMQKRLTTQAAQEILFKLTDDGWVTDVKGDISFSARAIIELGQYLKNRYTEQVVDCTLCKDLVILGDLCEHCGKKIHRHCAATAFQNLDASKRKCPSCKEAWENELIKLSIKRRMSAAPAMQMEETPSQTNNGRSNKIINRRSRR